MVMYEVLFDVARHNKRNIPFTGNIAYSQQEYSYDNTFDRTDTAYNRIYKGKPQGRRLLYIVKDEVRQVVQATQNYKPGNRRKIIDENCKNVVRHAYYHEYRALQQLYFDSPK